MKALIFAAGLGTRLKPFTDTMPKALLPLAGKTLLEYQILRLKSLGITDIVVNIHHFPDMIISYLREHDNFGCNVQVSDERDLLLETGGGLRKAAALLRGNEPVLVCNVDILSNLDFLDFIQSYEAHTLGSIVVSPRETQRYLVFKDNRLVGWTNIATGELKGGITEINDDMTKLAFSGMHILSPKVFDCLDEFAKTAGDKFPIMDFYLWVCSKEIIRPYLPRDYKMMDVGKIDHIKEAEQFAEKFM